MRALSFFFLSILFGSAASQGQPEIDYFKDIFFLCDTTYYRFDHPGYSDDISYYKKRSWNLYNKNSNIKDIGEQDKAKILEIEDKLQKRAGTEVYKKYNLQFVRISKNAKKSKGMKYALHYFFELDSTFYHHFVLIYDENGHLMSDYEFPETNGNEMQIIDYCEAIAIAQTDSSFKTAYDSAEFTTYYEIPWNGDIVELGRLDKMQLGYDEKSNSWTWELFTKVKFDGDYPEDTSCVTGWWKGKKIIINAQSSEILSVEDYKVWKSVRFG